MKATFGQNLNKTDSFGHVITREGPHFQAVRLEIAGPRAIKVEFRRGPTLNKSE